MSRRTLGLTAVGLLVVLAAGVGVIQYQLSPVRDLFHGEGSFSTGSDTGYGGPLKPDQLYAEEGPRFTNTTGRTLTLEAITLDPWCRWLGPGRCSPTSDVRIVRVLYLGNRIGTLTNGRWPPDPKVFQSMIPYLRNLRTPVQLKPGARIDVIYVMEATAPGVYLMPGRWIDYGVSVLGPWHQTFRFHELGEWALCVQPARCPSWAASSPQGA